MADPTPSVGQPDAEYLELYNRSVFDLNIEGFEINGGVLAKRTFPSQSYLLITSTSNYSNHFSALPNAIGIAGFGALTNTGESVSLRDQFGNVVDSLSYNLSWYGDVEKQNGGFALELINPDLPCSEGNNWAASSNESGGTPGLQNAVFSLAPDLTAPNISNLEVISSTEIKLQFSEPINFDEATSTDFLLSENTISEVSILSIASLKLTLSSPLFSNATYELTITNLTDCSGNMLSPSQTTFYYDVESPSFVDLVVLSQNEVARDF